MEHSSKVVSLAFVLAATVPMIAHANCATTLSNKVGDKISVIATLSSSDPNENGEGEPAIFSSSGGDFSGTVGDYFTPHVYTYTATQADETISGYNLGADADESCSVSATANPPPFPSSGAKKAFGIASAGAGALGGVAGIGAATCAGTIVGLPCAGVLAVTGGILGLISGGAGLIAADPIDNNYTQIAQPSYATVFVLPYGDASTSAFVQAYNALNANGVKIVGLQQAVSTSLNRASGARAAGATQWVDAQVQAAQQYTTDLVPYYAKEVTLLDQFASALAASPYDITTTASQAYSFETTIAYSGLPQDILTTLNDFGADSTTINNVANILRVQDIYAVSGNLSGLLANSSTLSDFTNLYQTLAGPCSVVESVKASFGLTSTEAGYNAHADLNHDGVINVIDLAMASSALPAGTTCP